MSTAISQGLPLGPPRSGVFNGSSDDDNWFIDRRMIRGPAESAGSRGGGARGAPPPGETPSVTAHLHSLDGRDDSHH